MGKECARHGGEINAYETLVWKPEEARPLKKPRRRVEKYVKTNTGREGVGEIYLAPDKYKRKVVVETMTNFIFQKIQGIS
jgi:hypothetical protein